MHIARAQSPNRLGQCMRCQDREAEHRSCDGRQSWLRCSKPRSAQQHHRQYHCDLVGVPLDVERGCNAYRQRSKPWHRLHRAALLNSQAESRNGEAIDADATAVTRRLPPSASASWTMTMRRATISTTAVASIATTMPRGRNLAI